MISLGVDVPPISTLLPSVGGGLFPPVPFAIVTVGVPVVLIGVEGVGAGVGGVSTAKAENGSVTATAMETIWTILEICIGFLCSWKL